MTREPGCWPGFSCLAVQSACPEPVPAGHIDAAALVSAAAAGVIGFMTRSSRVLKLVSLLALAGAGILSGPASFAGVGDLADDGSHAQQRPAQVDSVRAKPVPAGPEPTDPHREIEQALVAEHASKVVKRLLARGRRGDAALALLLRPLAKHMEADALDLAPTADDLVDAAWHALFEDLDSMPLSLLHALAATAKSHAEAEQWQRFEATLLDRDGSNLDSWLHRVSALQDDPAALDAWLARAVQRVERYESLSFEPVVLMVDALASAPMPPELAELLRFNLAQNLATVGQLAGDRETAVAARASDRELWAIPVLGVHAAIATPSLGDFVNACSVEAAALSRARRQVCLGLIRRALPGAGSLLEQSLLTGGWVRLVDAAAEEAEALAERRTAQWQWHHGISLMNTARDMEAWLDYHARPGASELGWVRHHMRVKHIPLQPPEDWDPESSHPLERD